MRTKSIITILVIILLLVLGGVIYQRQPQKEQSKLGGEIQEENEVIPPQAVKPEITFKPALKYEIYEDKDVSFGLYYESELGTLKLGNLIEIYAKNSPKSKDLAGGDIDVQLFLNQSEGAYDRHIKSIEDQNLRTPGGKGILDYRFPESEKELRDIKEVQYLYYPNEKTDDGTGGLAVYFISFKKDPSKKNYVTVQTSFDTPKRWNEIGAILDTIILK